MNAIGFGNLRSLRKTPDLAIRPITVFVGANSSGKSTFLRALPLLRQSVEARKNSPVLWYGRFVDFGSFRETVFCNDEKQTIQLRFSFSFQDGVDDEYFYSELPAKATPPGPQDIVVSIDISGTEKEFRDYPSHISIKTPNDEIKADISRDGQITKIVCNENDITAKFPPLISTASSKVVPNIGRHVERHVTRADGQSELTKIFTTSYLAEDGLVKLLKPFFSGRTKDDTVREFARRLFYGSAAQLVSQIERQVGTQRVLRKRLKALITNPKLIEDLRLHLIVNTLPRWLSSAEDEVRRFAESVSYIAPVRASTERYYRAQDLAVDEVDPQGENIPMFLQTLSISDRDSLSAWLTKHFNFSVSADYSSGHISLRYKEPDLDRYYNLADMGFGYSQILPILVQIWAQGHLRVRRTRRERGSARIFAIEQPELHLHPRLQSKFADLLSSVIQQNNSENRSSRFVVETHSEAMVNRFGALVRNGDLKNTDISVVVFERDPLTHETSMRLAEYDDRGLLQNWPYGFFSNDAT